MATAVNAPAKSAVLNSWKEIAGYLGRGVRTVQRWEHDLGLPVRRPRGKSRSAVVAMADELDAWLRQAPASETMAPEISKGAGIVSVACASRDDSAELRRQCQQLRSEHRAAIATLVNNLKTMASLLAQRSEPLPPPFRRQTQLEMR